MPPDDGQKERPATGNPLGYDIGLDLVSEEGGPPVLDLVMQGDPEMPAHGLDRRNGLPVADDGILDPFQIYRVIDKTGLADVLGENENSMQMRRHRLSSSAGA